MTNEEAAVLERDDEEFYSDVEFFCDLEKARKSKNKASLMIQSQKVEL